MSWYRVRAQVQLQPPYTLIDQDDVVFAPGEQYLMELLACDASPLTIKAYADQLKSFLNALAPLGIAWDAVRSDQVRDHILWMKRATKTNRIPRGLTSPVPGSLNPQTGKPYLPTTYQPTTINHRLTVITGFYQHHIGRGTFAPPNPARPSVRRRFAHHNPEERWVQEARTPYRQRLPKTQPRYLSDAQWDAFFHSLTCDRDRALFILAISAGSRAGECLRLRLCDVNFGDQTVRLIAKGTRNEDWIRAAPEFFTWLTLYLARSYADILPDAPLWVTRRHPRRALTYDALRAVLTRANATLETNWTFHDFRHTCGYRLGRDPQMTLVAIQAHLRHAHVTTTQRYLAQREDDVQQQLAEHHQRRLNGELRPKPMAASYGYDPADLEEFFDDAGLRK